MFVGHYGPSYCSKVPGPTIPLWILFLAVQLLDVLWGIFVLTGIEHVRIVPGITATNPLDLYHMPYKDSLVGALGWSVAAALAYRLWRGRAATRDAQIVGAAVFSHWVLAPSNSRLRPLREVSTLRATFTIMPVPASTGGLTFRLQAIVPRP